MMRLCLEQMRERKVHKKGWERKQLTRREGKGSGQRWKRANLACRKTGKFIIFKLQITLGYDPHDYTPFSNLFLLLCKNYVVRIIGRVGFCIFLYSIYSSNITVVSLFLCLPNCKMCFLQQGYAMLINFVVLE